MMNRMEWRLQLRNAPSHSCRATVMYSAREGEAPAEPKYIEVLVTVWEPWANALRLIFYHGPWPSCRSCKSCQQTEDRINMMNRMEWRLQLRNAPSHSCRATVVYSAGRARLLPSRNTSKYWLPREPWANAPRLIFYYGP